MQWLIDIVIEYLRDNGYLLPAYIYRGDPAAFDFTLANFTANSAWHDLDLSAIVPLGAKAVHLRCQINNISSGKTISIKRGGQINSIVGVGSKTFAAYGTIDLDWIVACGDDRIIQYRLLAPATWTIVNLNVNGWIL